MPLEAPVTSTSLPLISIDLGPHVLALLRLTSKIVAANRALKEILELKCKSPAV